MTPEEELQNLAPEPEVQVWKADEDGVLRLVLAESGAQHDDRLAVAEIWAATEAEQDK